MKSSKKYNTDTKEQKIESLKESEKRYRIMFETSPVGIVILNDSGSIINISDTVLDFTGLKKDELIGRHFTKLKFFHCRDKSKYTTMFNRLLLVKKIDPFIVEWKHRDERPFIGEVRASLIKKNKKSREIQIIVTDLTERIKIEKKLEDSEEFNKNILKNSTFSIYVMDKNKKMKYVNPAFEKITGFSSDEIIGTKPPYPYWIKDMKNVYFPKMKQVLNNKVNKIELPFINKNGTKFWAEINEHFVKSNGKTEYIIGNFTDITDRKNTYTRMEKVIDKSIDILSSLVETRDPYTSGHQERVSLLSVEIAKELKLSEEKIKIIEMASRLHDIGKINIPPSILSKPGKLSDIEFNIVKTHARVGYDIIKRIDFQYPVAEIILQHHERIDGSGYPRGLKGKDIMIEAKIIGVADVVEAISSHRPYRPSLGLKASINEITKNKGKLYDPKVVDTCLKIIKSKKFSFDN